MPGGSIFRFLTLAGFIIVVAVALWLIDVRRPYVVLGVALAWAIASIYEWLAWREAEVRWPPKDWGRVPAPPARGSVRVIPREATPPAAGFEAGQLTPEPEPESEPAPKPSVAVESSPPPPPPAPEPDPLPTSEREPEPAEPPERPLPATLPDEGADAVRQRPRFFQRATAGEEGTPAAQPPQPEPEPRPQPPAPPAASVPAAREESAPRRSMFRRKRDPEAPQVAEAAPETPPAAPEPELKRTAPEAAEKQRAPRLGRLFKRDKPIAEPMAEEQAGSLAPRTRPPVRAAEERPSEAAPPPAPPDPPPAPPPPPPPPAPAPPKPDPPRRREPTVEEQPKERPAPPRLVPPAPAPPPVPREPVAVSPPPRPAAVGAPVVQMPRRGAPRNWNLWDLEWLAREETRRTPGRADEWRYLVLYLRDFARADGELPTEFDGLVRESFGNLLDRLRV